MICTRDVSDVEYPKSCPDCGHAALAHSFDGNVVEVGCAVCQMLATRDALQAFADEAARQMRDLVARARVIVEEVEGADRG